jgi:hypothetical protein
MMRVQLVNDLHSGMKLYFAGQEWDVRSAANQGLYDFQIKSGKTTLYLDRVWVSIYGKGEFYFRVCAPNGDFVKQLRAHHFNKIVSYKG